jgi:hypothetical protein
LEVSSLLPLRTALSLETVKSLVPPEHLEHLHLECLECLHLELLEHLHLQHPECLVDLVVGCPSLLLLAVSLADLAVVSDTSTSTHRTIYTNISL